MDALAPGSGFGIMRIIRGDTRDGRQADVCQGIRQSVRHLKRFDGHLNIYDVLGIQSGHCRGTDVVDAQRLRTSGAMVRVDESAD
ncbi:Uncharacterised protein [Mycobacteroides abscessus subsp. massiliense]|nr:Uncharacterised protein [Mycobacteroides abscessus subsp. massiliense]